MTMEHGIARLVEDSGFRDEVLRELSGDRCAVPCRWLYDDRGSEQFEDITRLEEYYPTRTEVGILREAATPVGTFAGPRRGAIDRSVPNGGNRRSRPGDRHRLHGLYNPAGQRRQGETCIGEARPSSAGSLTSSAPAGRSRSAPLPSAAVSLSPAQATPGQ